jgi:quinol monooxygenase YgiN
MQITVMITWKLKQESAPQCYKVIFDLRASAMRQPGYLSSETLQGNDDPLKITVLSKWENVESWNKWMENPERQSIADQVKDCLAEPTRYEIFRNLRLRDKLKG